MSEIDVEKYKSWATPTDRYERQLQRLRKELQTSCIESAVNGAVNRCAPGSSFVIYGEPQSGKTEMMICLTAKLLDRGHPIIVHLTNDSVDLLTQNLKRFKLSGLAPAPKNWSELTAGIDQSPGSTLVVFCKKNARDLEKLIELLSVSDKRSLVIIDDEADYATPNGKVNRKAATKINTLVGDLLGSDGSYIGVTATPARLDLNNTLGNDTGNWVQFPPHSAYTGQDVFFPFKVEALKFRLVRMASLSIETEAREALARFLVTAAYLNTQENESEKFYSMLVHTSGKKVDHDSDKTTIEEAMARLNPSHPHFKAFATTLRKTVVELYPNVTPEVITKYILENSTRLTPVVLNSERDRKSAGDTPTDPTSPFTVIIGGNIVSRGVTFPNLLSMFFTRNVSQKLQQDTYIQRARMFGARGKYLQHFELTIPDNLYEDWRRCFIFHRLALQSVTSGLGSPVWIGSKRIAVASPQSIDKSTVSLDQGEMAFAIFEYDKALDELIRKDVNAVNTLRALQEEIGAEALPQYLIDFIASEQPKDGGSLGIHLSSSISKYGPSADKDAIHRDKGFLGKNQLELGKEEYASATHHVKILYNNKGKARLFYKYKHENQKIQFIRNRGNSGATSTSDDELSQLEVDV